MGAGRHACVLIIDIADVDFRRPTYLRVLTRGTSAAMQVSRPGDRSVDGWCFNECRDAAKALPSAMIRQPCSVKSFFIE
jgi:hypothetical protein